ncbi:MAG TPA: zf-HC2 domain-containing protein, partial [Planctomycetaceae bacterium]|nr:zf-HC2 domain-containing protein [Planctomycetaceae bacterium]
MTETKHEMARQLSAYYDGQLDEMSAHAVGQHLADCPQCRETYRQFEAISALAADAADRFEPPDSLAWNHFSRQLHDAPIEQAVGILGARGHWSAAMPWQPLATAAVFLLAIGLVAWWNWTGMGGLGPATDLTTFVQRFVRDPE